MRHVEKIHPLQSGKALIQPFAGKAELFSQILLLRAMQNGEEGQRQPAVRSQDPFLRQCEGILFRPA